MVLAEKSQPKCPFIARLLLPKNVNWNLVRDRQNVFERFYFLSKCFITRSITTKISTSCNVFDTIAAPATAAHFSSRCCFSRLFSRFGSLSKFRTLQFSPSSFSFRGSDSRFLRKKSMSLPGRAHTLTISNEKKPRKVIDLLRREFRVLRNSLVAILFEFVPGGAQMIFVCLMCSSTS